MLQFMLPVSMLTYLEGSGQPRQEFGIAIEKASSSTPRIKNVSNMLPFLMKFANYNPKGCKKCSHLR
jgi:hypothetical protein